MSKTIHGIVSMEFCLGLRSLSCELHFGKDGICYFGDESRGHVLSHAFTLKDTQVIFY